MNPIAVRTILVPTDFSECSHGALRYGVALAEVFSARVVVLHVMERPAYGLELPLAHPTIDPGVIRQVAGMAEECVERVRIRGLEVAWDIQFGVPFAEIRTAIERHHADLVVMGTHGRTGLAHVLLGSVAERVVQRASCPVLTVKAPPAPAAGERISAIPQAQAAAERRDAQSEPRTAVCYLCGQPSSETICETCKIRVQAEAVAKKLRVEREGHVDLGRIGMGTRQG
ncbi:MAG: universal stress protein [Nitrospiria bacterium]